MSTTYMILMSKDIVLMSTTIMIFYEHRHCTNIPSWFFMSTDIILMSTTIMIFFMSTDIVLMSNIYMFLMSMDIVLMSTTIMILMSMHIVLIVLPSWFLWARTFLLMSIYILHDFNDHGVRDIVWLSTSCMILMTMTWFNDQRHCSDVSTQRFLVYGHCSYMSTILYHGTLLFWCVLTFLLCIPMWF